MRKPIIVSEEADGIVLGILVAVFLWAVALSFTIHHFKG
jgi:hypothetical protein